MSSGGEFRDEFKKEGDVKMARKTNGQGREWGRRKILKGAGALAGAAVGSGMIGAPMIWAQNNKNIVLRQCGTGVSAFNEIAEKAKADLGFTLQMTALDSDAVVQRVVTQPNSFDIGDIEYWMVKKVFGAKTLQAMDTKKIKYFDKIVPIFTTGKLKPDSVIAQGTGAVDRRLRRRQGLGRLRQGADPVVHHDPDDLQRRHLGHSAPTWSAVRSPSGRTSWIRSSRARPRS
jgi:hypothetical protein